MQVSGDAFYVWLLQNIFMQRNILVIEFGLLPWEFHVVDIIVVDEEKILLVLDF
jgi:hypothetical protein